MRIVLLLSCLFACPCFAQSGADVLLDELGEKKPVDSSAKNVKKAPVTTARAHKVGDSFQQQLESDVQGSAELPFDVRQWASLIADSEFTKAAHLWTSIQMQVPAGFRAQADATQLYLLWKLALNQTFFDQWVKSLSDSVYAQSAPELALEALITPALDGWLLNSAVVVSPMQQEILDRLSSTKSFVLTLKAWNDMRREKQAEEILPRMLGQNKLTRFVAQTVIYDHVRRGDLKGAAKILRDSVEPAIEASQDAELLAKHDVSIARILYQAGQMAPAAQFYQKVPNGSSSYLAAREELSWVYLRQGDTPRLRGEIKALTSPVFKDRFQPEVYLLRSVSDLKMCFYDQLDKDLSEFASANTIWAKRIDQAVTTQNHPAPPQPDEYTQLSTRSLAHLQAEVKRLDDLGTQSIGATLPAVGWQKHWKDYKAQAMDAVEEAKKHQSDEYIRQWKNMRTALQEAIRKIRFVKVEYMSQLRQLSAGNEGESKHLLASNSDSLPASAVVKEGSGQLNFPATNEVWPDELFKLRSAAQAQCLKKAGVQ